MAEFLIKAIDDTHSDPVKDKRGSYKRGDIVQVYEDGGIGPIPSKKMQKRIVSVIEKTRKGNEVNDATGGI